MPHNLKLRIILPVLVLNIVFLACLVVHASMRLSGAVPGQMIQSLLLTAAAWTTAWLIIQLFVLHTIAGRLERRLRGFSDQAMEIASGHIRSIAPASEAGAADSLMRAFREMTGFLDQSLMKTITASGRLFSSTVNLQEAAEQCSGSAEQQQAGAHAIASAVEEMSQTIAAIACNSNTAADTSRSAMGIVNEGQEAAGRAVEAAASVEKATGDLAAGIAALNGSVLEIGDIVAVINDIADQTNLLALNASIEAARSGEHGRGFAVVADEVRNLAARTIAATAQISGKIGAVQRESQMTSASMTEAAQEVQNARSRIGEMEGSLHNISASFEMVNDQVTQIATAVEQQSVTTAQVSSSIETTSQMSATLSGVSAKVMAEVATIGSITDNLLLQLGAFRLAAHYRAAADVEKIAGGDAIRSMERRRQEQELREALRRNACVELFYITNANGRQVTSNIACDALSGGNLSYGTEAFGKSWENRPWFKGVRESGSTYISELYRSAATGSFCCTIAVPIRNVAGEMVGVLGADIDVVRIGMLG